MCFISGRCRSLRTRFATLRVSCANLFALVLPLAVASTQPAHAQFGFLYTWNNSAGGAYAAGSNWFPTGVPDQPNEGAQFDLNRTYTVNVVNNYTVGDLNVYQGNVTLALQPGTFTHLTYTTGGLTITPTSSTPTLTVQDGNLTVTGNSVIGNGAAGNFVMADGVLTTAATTVGVLAGGNGHLTVNARGGWTSSASASIGDAGTGQLDLQAGSQSSLIGGSFPAQSTATTSGAMLGKSAGGSGTANVAGIWNTGDLVVGSAGAGTINLKQTTFTSEAFLDSAGELNSTNASIAAQPGSSGAVNVTGTAFAGLNRLSSSWSVSGSLAVGGTPTAQGGSGTLAIGTLNSVTVGSNLKMWTGSTLAFAQGGTFNITGTATLAGNLNFSVFTPPHAGDSFQILSAAAGISGTFASTTLPPLDPGLAWNVVYAPTSVSLSVVAGVQGDFNNNGRVDAGDYVVWRNNLNSTTALPNDLIGGTIGAGQYDEWRSHFGQTSGSGSGAILGSDVAVPEPVTVALIPAVGIFFTSRRRTR